MNTFTWDAMLDGFRRFGGVAENVEQRQGPHGLGLFAIDRHRPVRIHVPESLLVPTDNIRVDGDTLTLIDPTPHPAGFGEWFALFHRHFSWGAEGRRSVADFEEGMAALPDAVLKSLKTAGLLRLDRRHEGEWEAMALGRFLKTRSFDYQGTGVLMPVIELINHGPDANGFVEADGIEVSGDFPAEVLVHYSVSDPIRRFFGHGFCCPEQQAFSLPLKFQLNSRTRMRVGSHFSRATADEGEKLAGYHLPEIQRQDDVWVIDYLLLAAERTPRIPRTLLCKALLAEPGIDAGELFDVAHSLNLRAYYAILQACEPFHTPMVTALRSAVLTQLEALSHHYGVRRDLLA